MMDERDGRALVIAEARKWIGTPYHSGAGLRGVGCDCGQLLVRAFCDCGLVPPFETGAYPADFHMHRDEPRYLEFVEKYLTETASPQPGDAVVFKIGRTWAHGGLITAIKPYLVIVHAYLNARVVLEEQLRPEHELMKPIRAPRFFTLWLQP